MFKIWAKTLRGDKILLSRVFEFEGLYKKTGFYQNLVHICREMDIPTPVVLKKHSAHFEKFNTTRFLKVDFVEQVDFSSLLIENIAD